MKSDELIRKILGSQTNNKSVRAQAIYNVLREKNEDEKIHLLSICLTEMHLVNKNYDTLKNEGLTELQWQDLLQSLAQMIRAHINSAFFKTRTAEEFARQVLKLMNFYDTEEEKIVCLAYVLNSEFVPFIELPGERLKIDSERYNHLLSLKKDDVRLIDYIIQLPFKTMTEEASHILHILDKHDGIELRACLLGYYARKKDELLEKKFKND